MLLASYEICEMLSRRGEICEWEVPTKNLENGIDVIDIDDDQDGFSDPLSPIIVREQRIAKARHVL